MENKVYFQRYEQKYVINSDQFEKTRAVLNRNAAPDKYFHSSIRNVYLDTDDYLLVRRSIEHPVYKEKLRFRSYGSVTLEDKIFVEIKKKYRGIVYKRRMALPIIDVDSWFSGEKNPPETQIGREIEFMRCRYKGIHPMMYISYERDSYIADNGLRITFDDNILASKRDLTLEAEPHGVAILPEGYRLMEVKTIYGYPVWLRSVLSDLKIYKTTFSKYGNAYKIIELKKTPLEYTPLERICPDPSS